MLRPIALSLLASTAAAGPQVVTDIAPIHSLVAQVMEGVGTPHLLVRPGASPHSYALRPSDASAMQNADVVVWVGEALSPWLAEPVDLFAEDAKVVELMDIEGTNVLKNREAEDAHDEHHDDHDDDHDKDHDHDHEKDHDDDHGEDHDHDEHGHDDDHAHEDGDHDHEEGHAHEDHDHDEHAHDEHGHEGHGHDHHHGIYDPHVWLDPANAAIWVGNIAAVLAEADPENAALYASNAAAAQARLEALDKTVSAQLAGVKSNAYVAVHDAYQYFETRYDLRFAGSITGADDIAPGAGGLAELTEKLRDAGVTCAVKEPGSNPRWVSALLPKGEGAVVTISPLGVEYETGPELYTALIESIGRGFETCLKP